MSERLLAFERRTRRLFEKFNKRGLPRERIEALAHAVEAAEWIAHQEVSVAAKEATGRFEQTLRRRAKGLLRRTDDSLLAEWQNPHFAKRQDRTCGECLKPNWTDPHASENSYMFEIRRRVIDRAWRLGVEATEIDAPLLRAALTAVSKGEVLPEPTPSTAFMEAIGASPIKETRRAGGPTPNETIGDITFYLAYSYGELTGRAPGYSATGERPDGTFRDFVHKWAVGDAGDTINAVDVNDEDDIDEAEGEREFRETLVADRKMRAAVARLEEEHVRFSLGDGLNRIPHKRLTPLSPKRRKPRTKG